MYTSTSEPISWRKQINENMLKGRVKVLEQTIKMATM
jgi:hypothetical protein